MPSDFLHKAEHFISGPYQSVDLNYVRVALALAYAHAKLEYALNNHAVPVRTPEVPHPEYLDELEYLQDEFQVALSEYGNMVDEDMLKNLDFTYEDEQ